MDANPRGKYDYSTARNIRHDNKYDNSKQYDNCACHAYINQITMIMDKTYLASTIIPLYIAVLSISHEEFIFAVVALVCAGILLYKSGVTKK